MELIASYMSAMYRNLCVLTASSVVTTAGLHYSQVVTQDTNQQGDRHWS